MLKEKSVRKFLKTLDTTTAIDLLPQQVETLGDDLEEAA